MSLRAATPADAPEIASLVRELAEYERLEHEVTFDEDELRRHLFGDAADGGDHARRVANVLIAEDDDTHEIAGMALYYRTFSTFLGRPGIWLEDLFVRPPHRGKGHGLALLQRLKQEAGDGRLEWAVLDWNQPAIEFYEALGAEPVPGWTRYRWL